MHDFVLPRLEPSERVNPNCAGSAAGPGRRFPCIGGLHFHAVSSGPAPLPQVAPGGIEPLTCDCGLGILLPDSYH